MNLPILGISYKWNLTLLVLPRLAYFTLHNIVKVHPRCTMYQTVVAFVGLNNIPHIHITFCLSITL